MQVGFGVAHASQVTTPPLPSPSLPAVHLTSEVAWGHRLRGFPRLWCGLCFIGGRQQFSRPFLPLPTLRSLTWSGDVPSHRRHCPGNAILLMGCLCFQTGLQMGSRSFSLTKHQTPHPLLNAQMKRPETLLVGESNTSSQCRGGDRVGGATWEEGASTFYVMQTHNSQGENKAGDSPYQLPRQIVKLYRPDSGK